MSSDKVVRSSIQRAALRIVRAEMHLYDNLASKPRLRVDRSNIHTYDAIVEQNASEAHGSRSCAHGRALHVPCAECERSEEDCQVYRVAASQRIKELLKLLGE
jgi:hypothetical protein